MHLDDETLSDLLDDSLAGEQLAAAEVHLRACARCAAALDGLRATVRLLRRLPEVEPPRRFDLPVSRKVSSILPRLALWTRAGTGLAATFLAIVLVAEALTLQSVPDPLETRAPASLAERSAPPSQTGVTAARFSADGAAQAESVLPGMDEQPALALEPLRALGTPVAFAPPAESSSPGLRQYELALLALTLALGAATIYLGRRARSR